MKKIIFKYRNKVAILIPAQKALEFYGLKAIAKKDVPSGKKYWIIDTKDIPEDREFRNAWELDEKKLGKHDGIGGESHEFDKPIETLDIYSEGNIGMANGAPPSEKLIIQGKKGKK